MRKTYLNRLWFSIVEILVGMFIFSIWLISVLAIISSTLNVTTLNQNYIIASNLAREQLELFRNIRDSNYQIIHRYDQIDPNGSYKNASDFFETGSYYMIENDYSRSASFPIRVEKIKDFSDDVNELNGKMRVYRLCLDEENRYVFPNDTSPFNCKVWDTETKFYRYVEVREVNYSLGSTQEVIADALKVTSKVIWYMKWYHDLEISTVIADWKRL